MRAETCGLLASSCADFARERFLAYMAVMAGPGSMEDPWHQSHRLSSWMQSIARLTAWSLGLVAQAKRALRASRLAACFSACFSGDAEGWRVMVALMFQPPFLVSLTVMLAWRTPGSEGSVTGPW